MTIRFHNVTPAPLAGVIDLKTDIWQKECILESGRKYSVIAPSGKGKSTFIHCIYGLRYDYTGSVSIDGTDVRDLRHDEWAELRQNRISIVYQDLRLFLNLTALQNIHVKAKLSGEADDHAIMEMADALSVSHVLNKPAHTLSYGERQRIAIIRALMQPFSLLLLDEPFSHLDLANAMKASAMIKASVNRQGASLIITSLGHEDHFDYDTKLQL